MSAATKQMPNQEKATQEPKDGSEVGETWTHLLMHPTGTPSQSSEEQSEQPMESQLIWSLEPKIAEDVKNRQ